jgi:hypothetical protein
VWGVGWGWGGAITYLVVRPRRLPCYHAGVLEILDAEVVLLANYVRDLVASLVTVLDQGGLHRVHGRHSRVIVRRQVNVFNALFQVVLVHPGYPEKTFNLRAADQEAGVRLRLPMSLRAWAWTRVRIPGQLTSSERPIRAPEFAAK